MTDPGSRKCAPETLINYISGAHYMKMTIRTVRFFIRYIFSKIIA